MTSQDLALGTRLIRSAIAQHMPSAAVASRWVSAVSPEPWVRYVSTLIPYQDRPTGEGCYGLTRLTAWLKTQGITAGESYIRALRIDWLNCAMAVESRRGPVYCHADPVR